MIKATLMGQRLVAVFVLGCVLANFPVLSIFNDDGAWQGIPLLYLYVFGLWAAVIVLMAWIVER
ncbi:hypothetical protein [Zoogloea sp.]|uniref:hypothetical protein n=1 Tax=Zoogloea sp. TaxID=49181 RepID=UPI002D1F9AF4|nr:hypothetical protein [Zoogloea sp.]